MVPILVNSPKNARFDRGSIQPSKMGIWSYLIGGLDHEWIIFPIFVGRCWDDDDDDDGDDDDDPIFFLRGVETTN